MEAICNEYMPPKTQEIQNVEDKTKASIEASEQQTSEPEKKQEEEPKQHIWGPNQDSRNKLGLN